MPHSVKIVPLRPLSRQSRYRLSTSASNPFRTTLFAFLAGAFVAGFPVTGVLHAEDKTQERIGGDTKDPEDQEPEEQEPKIQDGKDVNRIDEEEQEKTLQVHYDISTLPEAVRAARERILKAAHTGDIEEMRVVIEANDEITPAFSFGDDLDPIAYWKQISRDGEGREILAQLVRVFSSGFVRMDEGTKDELIIWPYHFAYPLDALTPRQKVELFMLVNPDDAKTMEQSGGYFGYRAGISPDGIWQFFVDGD